MPGMDGVALTVKIREVQPGTPVILITGHGENGLRGQASAAGAFAFLNKPIDPIFIVALLHRRFMSDVPSRPDPARSRSKSTWWSVDARTRPQLAPHPKNLPASFKLLNPVRIS